MILWQYASKDDFTKIFVEMDSIVISPQNEAIFMAIPGTESHPCIVFRNKRRDKAFVDE